MPSNFDINKRIKSGTLVEIAVARNNLPEKKFVLLSIYGP